MLWWHWTSIGLTLIGLEALTLGALGNFYFLFLGLAALLTSLGVALHWLPDLWMQFLTFATLTVVFTWLFTRWITPTPPATPEVSDKIDSLIGDIGTTTTALRPGHLGSVEIREARWFAKLDSPTPLKPQTPIVVTKVEGITLWVKPVEHQSPQVSQQAISGEHS